MKAVTIEVPPELAKLLGSEDEVKREAKVALVLDLVLLGRIAGAVNVPDAVYQEVVI